MNSFRNFHPMGKNAPCRDCEMREVGCHSRCKVYRQYREEQMEYMRKRYKKLHEAEAEIERAKRKKKDGGWGLKRDEK